ncbi:class I SAM-dependent methyltransferase [Dyella choica]|uniref:Class I SAM-dependent methyltransferase n=1 Tax=Dyella choica TaxID=1927959 RepID=A0A432M824_9GAMM|nr:class I SAM-dependent methyltransferase [Dyella choica]RUL77605.1 class I SAM-dependent methyltransferase [Dyella choica]
MNGRESGSGLLGDTKDRDYARQLSLFNRFAAPELRRAIASLDLEPGARCLDAGCGTGEALPWLRDAAGANGTVIGMDLSTAHLSVARAQIPADVALIQADLTKPPIQPGSFDLIWSVNTINHVCDLHSGLAALRNLLRPGGRIAWGQSALLADMYFAWDARLERMTTAAVRQYYRDKYGLTESDLTAARALVGMLRRNGFKDVYARTFAIERVSPLASEDRDYLFDTLFRDKWAARLQPYLSDADHAQLALLCNPDSASYALSRPDFHFLQTFTLVVGSL